MKLRPEQLAAHLERELRPVYVVCGDEPLQRDEAADAIRTAARAHGFTARQVFHAESGFDWSELGAAAANLSLFGDRKLIDLRLPSGKPGDAGGKALAAYAAAPSEDQVLLLQTGKLDSSQQKTKWFKALEKAGAVVQVWPVTHRELPGWIARRLQSRGMRAGPETLALLAERAEGNLLAAAQEVEKLRLLYGEGELDAGAVERAVVGSARYSVFDLADAALGGDAARSARILDGLRGEGVEPILVLWALAREVRTLGGVAGALERGEDPERVFSAHRVWEKRKPLYRTALRRHPVRRWRNLLRRCLRVDRIIKGAEPGGAWDELIQLALFVAGRRVV